MKDVFWNALADHYERFLFNTTQEWLVSAV